MSEIDKKWLREQIEKYQTELPNIKEYARVLKEILIN